MDYTNYVQPNMKKPSIKNANYDRFWEIYNAEGYRSAIKKYGNDNIKNNLKKMAIFIIRKTGIEHVIRKMRKGN